MKVSSDLQLACRFYINEGRFEFVVNGGMVIVAQLDAEQMYVFRQWTMTVATPGAIYYFPRVVFDVESDNEMENTI